MKLFFDVETTGLDIWRNDIITGCFILEGNDGEVKEVFEFNSRPEEKSWGDIAAGVHGIAIDTALGFPHPRDTCLSIIQFFSQHKIDYRKDQMIMHTSTARYFDKKVGTWTTPYFDWNFLMAMFFKQDMLFDLRKYFDITEESVKSLWTVLNKLGVRPRTLKSACEVAGFPLTDHHNARHDTEALRYCWNKLSNSEFVLPKANIKPLAKDKEALL